MYSNLFLILLFVLQDFASSFFVALANSGRPLWDGPEGRQG
jgi:hypothetical protein